MVYDKTGHTLIGSMVIFSKMMGSMESMNPCVLKRSLKFLEKN